ncbi:MAG: type III toxin-antitoxin system ToxN/AbiQ family toxin [Cyanobacteria bacterium P01_F01_bin.143]
MKLYFYTVSDSYINFLKQIERKVPNNNYSNRKKLFIGIVLEINGHKYLAPLTSYKKSQDNISDSSPTIEKLHERGNPDNKLGMIQFRYMIPVIDSEIQLLDIENQPEPYKSMLYKQFEFMKLRTNTILKKARRLHKLVVETKKDFFCRKSCDFKSLEENYRNFS